MTSPYPAARRWPVALAGTALQLCLGTVYAWSYFQIPISQSCGWSNEAVTAIFSTAICCLGLAAAWAGWQLKKGHLSPRHLAVTGGILFGLGHLLAALALARSHWPLLLAGYGVVGGTGLGLGYVVPVATAARWFPDKKGLVTGLVVMGFGLGALVMSKVLAPVLLQVFAGNLSATFAALGGTFLVLVPLAGLRMKNPPDAVPASAASSPAAPDDPPNWLRFALLWLLFFCNIFAGIAIISFQSPLLQDLLRRGDGGWSATQLASAGATLIAASALCNGLGRLLWGAVSDRLGPARTFAAMFATQIIAFLALPAMTSPWGFGLLVCLILLCYGGGFGVVPSFVHQLFGEKHLAPLYGLLLTAWSAAGVAGPGFLATLRDRFPAEQASQIAFGTSAALMVVGLGLSLWPGRK